MPGWVLRQTSKKVGDRIGFELAAETSPDPKKAVLCGTVYMTWEEVLELQLMGMSVEAADK